jgi:hypothetical protein
MVAMVHPNEQSLEGSDNRHNLSLTARPAADRQHANS